MRQHKRRVIGAAALGIGAALVITGCGAGQITQTDTQEPVVNGAMARTATIVIANAALEYPATQGHYPAGANAPLRLSIVNEGPNPDELVSVTSNLSPAPAVITGLKDIPGRSVLVVGKAGEAEAQAPHAAPSPAAPTASVTPTAAPPVAAKPEIGKAEVVLERLNTPVWPGQVVLVTFHFRNAGPITTQVPIAAPSKPRTPEKHDSGTTGEANQPHVGPGKPPGEGH